MDPWRACPFSRPCCWNGCACPGDAEKQQCWLCKAIYHEVCRLQACTLLDLTGTGTIQRGMHTVMNHASELLECLQALFEAAAYVMKHERCIPPLRLSFFTCRVKLASLPHMRYNGRIRLVG